MDSETEAAAAFAESVAGELEAEPTPDTDFEDRGAEPEIESAGPPMVTAVEEGGAAVEPMPSPTPEVDVAPGPEVEGPAAAQDDVVAGVAPSDATEAAEEPSPIEAEEEPAPIEAEEEPAPPVPTLEEPAPGEEPEPIAATLATTEPEPEPEPIEWDPERYTVEIVEPDWYADEQAEAFAPASAPAPPPAVEAEPEAPAAAADASEPPGTSPPSSPSPSGGEETMLWFGQATQEAPVDEGADEIESVGAAPRSAAAPVPGSQELDDALAALEALSRGTTTTPDPPSEPSADESWPPAPATQGSPVDAVAAPPELDVSDDTNTPAGLLPSVRPPATSASRAYRRLRRIFPG